MTALTKRQADTTHILKSKHEGNSNPSPINSSVSVGDGQMTIDIVSKMDVRKSNNAAM